MKIGMDCMLLEDASLYTSDFLTLLRRVLERLVVI
jgi:hypothetical protein